MFFAQSIEDNEGDIELTKEAFEDAKFRNNLHVAEDGEEALDFLFKRNDFHLKFEWQFHVAGVLFTYIDTDHVP